MWFPIMDPFRVVMHAAAATGSYLLYSISQDPEVTSLVQAEKDALSSGERPTAQDAHKPASATNAAPETMRFYPIIPGIARGANLDISGLRSNSLEHSENLPPPDVIAEEMREDLRAALEQLEEITADLGADTMADAV